MATRKKQIWGAVDLNGELIRSTTATERLCLYGSKEDGEAEWAGDGWYEAGRIKIKRVAIFLPHMLKEGEAE